MPRRRQKIQNASGPSKAHSWNDPSRLSGQMGLTSRLPDGCTKLISKTSFCCKTYRSRSQGEWRRTQAEELNLVGGRLRSEEHTSELQSLMRISYAVFCLKKKKNNTPTNI